MKQVLSQSIVSGGNRSVFTDYALEFNGTDEYLQIALPSELVTNGNFETFPSWSSGNTILFTQDTETGKQGNYCAKWVFGNGGNLTITTGSALVVGQKYKVKMYYKSTTDIVFQSSITTVYTLKATSEWNYISFIFTAVGTTVRFYSATVAGTAFFDNVSMVSDQGFDLNKDQEQILHSKNWDFERTLGTELATGTVTIGKKYVVTAGTVEGNAVGTEFLAVTATTTLDASNKVREIPNLVTNGTFTDWTGTSPNEIPTGWSLSNRTASNYVTQDSGKLRYIFTTGTASVLSQTIPLIIGKRYRVTFQIVTMTSGGLRAQIGTATPTDFTTTGIKTYDITADQTYCYFARTVDNSDWVIDNIHIYEIPEWTASGNHTCDVSTLDKSGTGTQSLKVTASGAGDTSNCVTLPSANLESCVSGKKYTLQLESRLDASSLTFGSNLITNGTDWTDTTPADGVPDGWILGVTTGTQTASIIDGTVNGFTGNILRLECTSNLTGGYIRDDLTLTANKLYKIQYSIRSNVDIRILADAADIIDAVSSTSNVKTDRIVYYLASSTRNSIRFYFRYNNDYAAITGQYFEIDSVSVQEAIPITITAQLGTKSVTSSALSIVAGTFTKFVLNFEATASEVNQDLKMYLNGAGSVYVDKLSLTQKFDYIGISKHKMIGGNYIIGCGNNFRLIRQSDTFYITDGVYALSGAAGVLNAWMNVLIKITNEGGESYFNGVLNSTDTDSIGKIIQTAAMTIGARNGAVDFHNGQISHIQIIRFENISQSTFNSAIKGLQYPTGGGAEEVLRLTFQDGSSILNCLKDYSPKGHTVSGVNMDITNRKRVTS